MEFSVIMPYYNRKELLFATLKSIIQNCHIPKSEYEIVIVDDGSDEKHVLSKDMLSVFDLNIKLVSITKQQKVWSSPCIAFNMGFLNSTGKRIILQNPESLVPWDFYGHIWHTLENNQYISYGCYNANEEQTNKILALDKVNPESIQSILEPMSNGCWYNHSVYRNMNYFFLAGMWRKDFQDICGFDERYAFGVAFEDDEFLYRLKLKGIDFITYDFLFCVHLYHEKFLYRDPARIEVNRYLFNEVTKKENKWKANENSNHWN